MQIVSKQLYSIKGVIWCNFKFSFSLECYKLCIDKIPEVAKTKVSKPKRYSLSKLRFCHAPKTLIQTHPHMSTSRCGNICILQPICSHKERRRGFSNRSSVEAALSGRLCVFLCESKRTLFGLLKVDAFRNQYDYLQKKSNAFSTHGRPFREPRRGGNSDYDNLALLNTLTSIITVSVTWLFSPLKLELMVKLKTLLTVFTIILKAKYLNNGKGRYISHTACGVRPITMQ